MAKWIVLSLLIIAALWGGCGDRYEPAPYAPYPTAPTGPIVSWSNNYYYDGNRYKVSIFDDGDIEIALLGGPTFERLTYAAFTAWADTTLSDDPPVIDPGPNNPDDVEADPGNELPDPGLDPTIDPSLG